MQLGDIRMGFLRLWKSPSGVLRPRISANFQIKNFKQTNHYKIKTLPYLLWSYDGKLASFDRTSLKRLHALSLFHWKQPLTAVWTLWNTNAVCCDDGRAWGLLGFHSRRPGPPPMDPAETHRVRKGKKRLPPLSPMALTEKMNASSIGGHKVKSTHKGKIMNKSLCEWCHRGARSRGIASLFVCCFSKGHLSHNRSHMHRI